MTTRDTAEYSDRAAHLVRLAELAQRPVDDHDRTDDATTADLSVGDVAITFGHQKWRRGIVTKTTKGRVAVEFTTPGAINDAARLWTLNGNRVMADDHVEHAIAPHLARYAEAEAAGDHDETERWAWRANEDRDRAIATRALAEALPGHLRHLVYANTTCTPRPRGQVFAPATEVTA